MNFLQNNIEHYTPTKEQLKPFHQIKCSQPNCTSIFTNQANYEMHLEKHHRLAPAEKKSACTRLFYCPTEKCIYNYNTDKCKHFKNFKYLRQHYQKVHLVKDYICEECKKSFATETQLKKHQKDQCGKKFICNDCQWSYDSVEALLTHGKRKGHNVKEVIAMKKNTSKMALKPLKKPQREEQPTAIAQQQVAKEIQVDFCPKLLCATSVQTDFLPQLQETPSQQDISNALDDIHSLLRDIETQTEPFLSSTENHNYLDQMLGQSSHMYTQTCDDFLTELGLSDIQTQTNWPSPDPHNETTANVQFTSTATSTNNPCIHDELLVSTETQTSFTQCLLNSCTDAGTSTPPVSFGSLYHTQHTQTGDPLLESFDFGGQASDLIDGFQSTYTQT